jgi:hypothetical protein
VLVAGQPDRIRYRELALPIYEELGDLVGWVNTTAERPQHQTGVKWVGF